MRSDVTSFTQPKRCDVENGVVVLVAGNSKFTHNINICCPQKWGGQNTLRPPTSKSGGTCPPVHPMIDATTPMAPSDVTWPERIRISLHSTRSVIWGGSTDMRAYNFFVRLLDQSSSFFSSKVGGIAVDHLVFRFSICRSVPEIFAIKVVRNRAEKCARKF